MQTPTMNGTYPILCNPTYHHPQVLANKTLAQQVCSDGQVYANRGHQSAILEGEGWDYARMPSSSPVSPFTTTAAAAPNGVNHPNGHQNLPTSSGNGNSCLGGVATKVSAAKNGYPTSLPLTEVMSQLLEIGSCCHPLGCLRGFDDSVFMERHEVADDVALSRNAVRLGCDNPSCPESKWMHLECFSDWQRRLTFPSKGSRRSRHFSDKDVMMGQNFMPFMKRDFDQQQQQQDGKMNACRCGKGNLRTDFSRSTAEGFGDLSPGIIGRMVTPASCSGQWERRFSFTFRDNLGSFNGVGASSPFSPQFMLNNPCRLPSPQFGSVPSPGGFGAESVVQQILTGYQQQQQQPQFCSPFDRTTRKQRGSTSSASRSFDFFPDKLKASAGNIFHRRGDMADFDGLPKSSRNSYNVRVEDEGPYGNDETRCFLLTALSSAARTTVKCAVCRVDLVVYDKYPLINGTFFLSSGSYDGCGIEVSNHGRRPHHHQLQFQGQQQFLNAVCMGCASGSSSRVSCLSCGVQWRGRPLVVGTMYNYDVFAAMTCCSARLACSRCRIPIREFPTKSSPSPSFSDFCRPTTCPRCHLEACHAVKPLGSIFAIDPSRK